MFQNDNGKKKYNFIDLFAGAGGLSEGFFQCGFNPIAHVEMNPYAIRTLETRTCYYYLKKVNQLQIYYSYLNGLINREQLLSAVPKEALKTVIQTEMSGETLSHLFTKIDNILREDNVTQVDAIIGGPPCQAYSLVGRAQSSHMLTPMDQDPRNSLYLLYARFLRKYNPKVFVFENVVGITSAANGTIWRNVKAQLRRVGYEIECQEQNAADFGVLQSRRRMIIVGWRKNSGFYYPDFPAIRVNAIVNDLLQDLPPLIPGEENNTYSHVAMSDYIRKFKIRTDADVLTHHISRPNIERDMEIYRRAVRLWNEGHRRLNYNDLPVELQTHRNRTAFTDRFKVVEGDMPTCHTVLAHLSKDGHYFIHPDIRQHRSITVREAARLQSFPDNFFFEGPRTAQFIQIGNAVPPLMAKGIAEGILQQFEQE